MPSPTDPVAFTLFGIGIRWYAVIILVGIVSGVALIRVLAERRGLDPEFALDAAPWIVFAGLVGARIYYLLLRWDFYVANPHQALNLRLGGLTIHGALVGGILMLAWLCRRADVRFLAWCDVIIPGVALAQGIGRWGNWANQEAFGTPTDLPWGVAIAPDRRPENYMTDAAFHPTFLYESLFDFANAALLSWLLLVVAGRRTLKDGDILWIYLILYGIARFFIEGIRTDSLHIGPYPAAYWLSAAFVTIGIGMLTLRRLLPTHATQAEPHSTPD